MRELVCVALNLDTVLGGKYKGRGLAISDGDEVEVTTIRMVEDPTTKETRPVTKTERVKKEGFTPIRDAQGVARAYIRIDDGGPRPTDAELFAAAAEVAAMPEKKDPTEARIAALEAEIVKLKAK